MTLQDSITIVTEFIKNHHVWAVPIVFLLSFGESLAIVSLLLPATAILLAVGALIGADLLSFLPIWLSASVGAFMGDWVSYWLGKHYHQQIVNTWPLNKHPNMVLKAQHFFERFGLASVFIGRFFGPFRALVPLIAGTMQMPVTKFNLTNFASAFIWSAFILAPGAFGVQWFNMLID
ncbi:DedA family protein [Orbaceae bacterium ac157xtp]